MITNCVTSLNPFYFVSKNVRQCEISLTKTYHNNVDRATCISVFSAVVDYH